MKLVPLLLTLAGMAVLASHKAKGGPKSHGFTAIRNRMMKRMVASMPDDSPPKLVMAILPRLQAQNEKILAVLEEQNDLLRRLSAQRE